MAALGLTPKRPHGDSSGDVMVGFAHHDVQKNKIRNDWRRLLVRAEMAAVKEPDRPAGRSHAISLSAVQWM